MQNAPSLARSVYTEMCAFRNALNSVSEILHTTGLENTRGFFIPAEGVIVCLTDAVLLFDKIEQELRPFLKCEKLGMTERSQWAWKKSRIMEMVACLQWHKTTIGLQLSILRRFVQLSSRMLIALISVMQRLRPRCTNQVGKSASDRPREAVSRAKSCNGPLSS